MWTGRSSDYDRRGTAESEAVTMTGEEQQSKREIREQARATKGARTIERLTNRTRMTTDRMHGRTEDA